MGKIKNYSGYTSYQYLRAGEDFRTFKMAKQIGRVKSMKVELDKKQEEDANKFMDDNILLSLHDHPMVFPEDITQTSDYIKTGRIITGYEGLAVSRLDAIFDDMTDGMGGIMSSRGWKMDDVVYELGMKHSDYAHQDMVVRCERADDIVNAHKNNKIAMIPTIETSTPIENELDRLDVLYGLGVRSMGLVYHESNLLGSGRGERKDGGLTYFGEDAVERMNRLGILIDVSHCSIQTELDAMDASSKPIILSHCATSISSPDSIANFQPDKVFQKLADIGGVAGLMVAGTGAPTVNHNIGDLESYMEQVEHLIDMIGIDHVAVGPDLLFGDHVGLYKMWFRAIKWDDGERYLKSADSVDFVDGMESSPDFQNIVRWLLKNGYSNNEIAKVVGGNVINVLKKVW